jgi:L-alanine-DL-glutamate epimerase-like enolase superfamily enzyme
MNVIESGAAAPAGLSGLRITAVTATAIRPSPDRAESWLSESLVANPMSIYPDFRARRSSWQPHWGPPVLVRVQSSDGQQGIGAEAPAAARPFIEDHFGRLLVGQAFKLAMPHGPADGWEGMKANIALVEQARELVGPDAEIMLDCYMAWNVEYTLRMARLLEPLRVRWIEEALPPDDYEGYSELTARIDSTVIATGEHEYTRWGFRELIARRCCHILQPDLAWVGGITEARKVAALASAWGLDVIPHAGGLQPWTLHFIASTVNAPWAECVVVGNPGDAQPLRGLYPVLKGVPLAQDGVIAPADAPGVGVEVDATYLEPVS